MKTNNVKKSNVEKTIEKMTENALRVADVARELKLDEKRARAFLRTPANVAEYNTFRNKSFLRDSTPFKKCVALLTQYKQRIAPIAK